MTGFSFLDEPFDF